MGVVFHFKSYYQFRYNGSADNIDHFNTTTTRNGFLPEMDEGSIVLDYKTPPGTSLEETDKILREAEKIIVSVPEVEAYSRRTGTEMGFFITEPNSGDYLIQLKKNRDKTTDDVIEELRKKLKAHNRLFVLILGR
jgi:Putative silver efflux pump